MRTIKKLNLIFGQMLDEEQQSMVLAGGKAPCGCTGVNDCCLSSVDNNLPAYKMVCAQLAKLIVKPGPSGVSISDARNRVESGWALYLNYCNESSGTLPNAAPESVHEHWVKKCVGYHEYLDANGNVCYSLEHQTLGAVFSK